jgi:transposase
MKFKEAVRDRLRELASQRRHWVRAGLYMAALVATRHNAILATFYQRLRAAGKPLKLALTATMRKLLLVLNSALRSHPNLCLNSRQLLTVAGVRPTFSMAIIPTCVPRSLALSSRS